MTSKVHLFASTVCALFYCTVPLLYLFPQIATDACVGKTMLLIGLLVVIPSIANLFILLCRRGLVGTGRA